MSDPVGMREKMQTTAFAALLPLVALLIGVAAPINCYGEAWNWRPGLWSQVHTIEGVIVHIPTGIAPELAARLRAMALPHVYSEQICLQRGKALIGPTITADSEKIFTCTEKTVYKGSDAELIQDECFVRPDPLPGLEGHIPPYLKTVRYVARSGASKGMVWGVDETMKLPTIKTNDKLVLRWIAAKCGSAATAISPK
jgi:hypothetical protein